MQIATVLDADISYTIGTPTEVSERKRRERTKHQAEEEGICGCQEHRTNEVSDDLESPRKCHLRSSCFTRKVRSTLDELLLGNKKQFR